MSGAGGDFGRFRVFTVGRDAASRFRVRAPWRARPDAGPIERAVVAGLTFVLAVPVAVVILAIALAALVVTLGCAAVFVAFMLAMWIVMLIMRALFGAGPKVRARSEGPPSDGRENVRVLPRQDAGE